MSAVPVTPNVFSIPPGAPFLRCLARFALDGKPLDTRSADPFTLSRTTIYLPTRRAVRSLRSQFSALLGHKSAFLPLLRTLGDGDQEEMEPFLPVDQNNDPLTIIDPLTRQITLARLVKHWVEMIGVQTRELFKDEDIIIPSSSAESLWLAKEIGDLIDQMETEEISWNNLKHLVPNKDEYAGWWQLTLDFLQIAMQSWPQHLAQIAACDPATHRRQLLDIRTAQLQYRLANERIIAAGSTGSIPATARFLKAVSRLPQGVVILPGLDKSMGDEAWRELSVAHGSVEATGDNIAMRQNFAGCEDHPQFGMANLLKTFAISREDVALLGEPVHNLAIRAQLTSIALLPSAQTGQWRELIGGFDRAQIAAATEHIAIIEAPAERQEALAIALVLRQQIENPAVHAALVTPDRTLARRVASELTRFGLNINDTAGLSLKGTNAAIFIRLLISVATQPTNSLALASFVKHPYLRVNQPAADFAALGRQFEICLLRDVLEIPSADSFTHQLSIFAIH